MSDSENKTTIKFSINNLIYNIVIQLIKYYIGTILLFIIFIIFNKKGNNGKHQLKNNICIKSCVNTS